MPAIAAAFAERCLLRATLLLRHFRDVDAADAA